MSAIPETLRRQWLPVSTAVAVALIALLAWLSIAQTGAPSGEQPISIAAPGVRQAPWRIDASLEGRVGPLNKAQKNAYNRERPRVVELIESVYDGMFLTPGALPDLIAKSFTADAAKEIRAAKLGLPPGTSEVQIRRRTARLGVQATGSRAAAARVRIVAVGRTEARPVKVEHTSILWMSRDQRSWKVIGFDLKQRPIK